MMKTQKDVKALLEKTVKCSGAGEMQASFSESSQALTRFADNAITQNGLTRTETLTVTCHAGRRSGTASTTCLEEASLRAVVSRAEEIAKNAPEDPEYLPLLDPQEYARIEAHAAATENFSPQERAEVVRSTVSVAREKGLIASGTVYSGAHAVAGLNSRGLFASHQWTSSGFSNTMRTPDGTGSSRVTADDVRDVGRMDFSSMIQKAADRALQSVSPREIPTGEYTVILEPDAVASLLSWIAISLNAREADEGRSFMTGKLGQAIVGKNITIKSQPSHPELRGMPFNGEWVPQRGQTWIEHGTLKNLAYPRYWAHKQGKAPTGSPSDLVLPGETQTLDDLIRSTQRGLLITRFWYIRSVDPKQILITGITRDGTFMIEDGRVAHPVINYRFNVSPITFFSNVEAMTSEVKCGNAMVPAIKAHRFALTSPSRAV